MKNRLIKIIITISFIFSFIPITYAGVNDVECNVSIEKLPATEWKTNWKTNLKICDMKDAEIKDWDKEDFPSYEEAENYKNEWIYVDRESVDAKSIETIQIKRCDLPGAYISANVSCKVEITNSKWVCKGAFKKKLANGNCPIGYGACISGNLCYKEKTLKPTTTETTWTKYFESVDSSFNALSACNAENNGNCTECTEETYTLNCPEYSCIPKTEEVTTCTPTFRVENNPAYCVNPNQGFAVKISNGNNYKKDQNFNINKCFDSSYKKTDCGYANILIEGKYHNVDEQQVQLALRLWGVHTGAAGFNDNKTGVANVIGDSCNEYVTYISGDDVINIYKITHDYIWEYYFESLNKRLNNNEFKDGYIDASKPSLYFNETTCSKAKNGLICGKLLNYSSAFALFFNTYFGNKNMKEHLYSIVGYDGVDTEPTSATVETIEEISRIEINFERDINTRTNEKFNCKYLEEDKTLPKEKRHYPNLEDDVLREDILRYCNITVNHFYIVDENGEKIEINVDDETKEWDNYKGSIQFETDTFAACQVNNKEHYTHYELVVEYLKSRTTTSVEKYIACENPGENQYLFSFNSEPKSNTTTEIVPDNKTTDTKTLEVSINCVNEGCENYKIREDRNKCESQTEYDKYYTSSVKDPSLSCIVNMVSNTNKTYYDYSDYFKVNKNFCRVYCSDEVSYSIAGKTQSTSGLSFEYDIKPFDLNNEYNDKMFSSVIELKRNCVSEIYYNNEFPSDVEKNLKDMYVITDEFLNSKDVKDYFAGDDVPRIRTWKDLLYVLYKKSLNEGMRSENLNQVIYDLYNCNFISNIVSSTNNSISQPRDNNSGELYKYITNQLYTKENNYGLTNPNVNDTDKMWLNNVTYEGGAEYINNNSSVGSSASDIDMLKVIGKPQISNVKYCKGFAEDCLPYDSKNEDYDYKNSKTFGDISWGTTGINISAESAKKSVPLKQLKKVLDTKIPTNSYAMFSITTQIGFYNSTTFEIEPYSGKVNKVKDSVREDYTKLNSYSYPLSKDAYNICGESKEKGNKNTVSCAVKQTFNSISTYYRNRENDELFKTLNGTNYKEFNCSIDVKVPEVIIDNPNSKTIYRNVSLSNLFPSGNRENSNWFTELGQNAINDIQNSANSITKDDYYLEYSFDLTPQAIQNIRNYNATKENQGGYLDNSLSNCTLKDGKYFDCQSKFITEIASGNSIYIDNTSPNNKFDGISKFTQSNNN